ncbi:hypothetical protein ACF068_31015 [Streptomyces sp. NPDC016309]|uniref:hypothetical protein n=1 Tax=Streptomyces sp. NPDC016309 TaxID=3364965 RepID=UPI0036FB3D95
MDLSKRAATYLVIAEDGDALVDGGPGLPRRRVVYVERQSGHPMERRAQREELEGACLDANSPGLHLRTYTAVSHAHAASLARREYALVRAAARMAEVIGRHLESGARGWIAVRVSDGSSDGFLYADRAAAQAVQRHPERFTYFPISPMFPWTRQMCQEHLEFETHRLHGCMVGLAPTCR